MHRRFRNNNKKLLSSSQRCPTLTLHFKWCIYPRYRPHLQRSSQNGRGDFVPLRLTLCPGILVKTIQGLKTRQNTEAKNCRTSQRDKNVFQQKDFLGVFLLFKQLFIPNRKTLGVFGIFVACAGNVHASARVRWKSTHQRTSATSC